MPSQRNAETLEEWREKHFKRQEFVDFMRTHFMASRCSTPFESRWELVELKTSTRKRVGDLVLRLVTPHYFVHDGIQLRINLQSSRCDELRGGKSLPLRLRPADFHATLLQAYGANAIQVRS